MVDNKKTCLLLRDNFGKNETNVLFTQRFGLCSKTQKGSFDIECHPPLTQKCFKSPVLSIFICIIAQLPRCQRRSTAKKFLGQAKMTPVGHRNSWVLPANVAKAGAHTPARGTATIFCQRWWFCFNPNWTCFCKKG